MVIALGPRIHSTASAAEPSDAVGKVRTTLDSLIAFGRDRYGEQHSPLFAAILTEDTLECEADPAAYPVDPVRLDPGRYVNRRGPGGCNIAYDQAMLRSMVVMSERTGDPKYRNAALQALRWVLHHAHNQRGMPAMGGHTYWGFHREKIEAQGEHHELWNWPMAWELWWEADADRLRDYARLVWEWHVVDKETGETNRHSDKQHGWSFTFTDASFISLWSYVGAQGQAEPYRTWCRKVADYHWKRRNPTTNLFPSSGGTHGVSTKRWDSSNFTSMQATLAHHLIVAGRRTDAPDLVEKGRAILDAYARYGYDAKREAFYASLRLDGTPIKPSAERDPVTGQDEPVGYLAMWQPHAGWHELPLPLAQAYAWAAEKVDRDAYLPTAERFGRVLRRAWDERHAGCKDWPAFRDALKVFGANAVERIRGVQHSKYKATAGVDAKRLEAYRRGGYIYQAPYGLFADHYGRTIQFALTMRRATGDESWLTLADEVADAAIAKLWRHDRIFVGHVSKHHYYNTDHVGILLYALLQLDRTRAGKTPEIPDFF